MLILGQALADDPPVPEAEFHLMKILYDLNQQTQIPGRRHLYRGAGGTVQAQLRGPAQWFGISDDQGRLVAPLLDGPGERFGYHLRDGIGE